jgi:hypothetical protein
MATDNGLCGLDGLDELGGLDGLNLGKVGMAKLEEDFLTQGVAEARAKLERLLRTWAMSAFPPTFCHDGLTYRLHERKPLTISTRLGPIVIPSPIYVTHTPEGQRVSVHPLPSLLGLENSLSPGLCRVLLRGAAEKPFAQVVEELKECGASEVSPETVRPPCAPGGRDGACLRTRATAAVRAPSTPDDLDRWRAGSHANGLARAAAGAD